MKINVTENKVSIKEEQILNENEYNIHKIQFDFSSEYTDDLVKVALFSINNHTYKKIISNNECDIPPEVLTQRGYSILGVYAYKTEQDTLVLRYSPSPTKISVYDGSYKADAENSEPITPSEIEQYQQILQNSLQQFQNQYNVLVEETEGDIQAIENELQRKVDEGYFDGEDGFSPIANVIQLSNGVKIEIEDKTGRTSASVFDGYSPQRGVDYWTQEDKEEVIEEATQEIDGKIEEYNYNATEKLNQYNQNNTQKINDYNTNAEQKVSTYNTNAAEKLSAYNTNATEKFNDYNSNAEQKETNYNTNASQKVESFNTNANSKLSEYNSNTEAKKTAYDENATQKTNSFNTNATNKLTEYNTNHTEKMSAYNSNSIQKLNAFNENATQKTEDFDEHTEEIQDNIEILQRTDNQILSRFNKDEEVSGQDITLTGTTEIKFAKPPLPMGNSEQVQYSGKNLIPMINQEVTISGITFKAINGRLIINGTATNDITGNSFINNNFMFHLNVGNYVLSRTNVNSNLTINLMASDTQLISRLVRSDTNLTASFDVTVEKDAYIGFYIPQNSSFSNYECGVMVSTDGGTYEPYVGGTSSPNPDYPQEITNVTGDVEVVVGNKNLAWNGWAEDFVRRINYTPHAEITTLDNRNCLKYVANAGYGNYDNKYIFKTKFKENTQYTFMFDMFTDIHSGNICIEYTDGTVSRIRNLSTTAWNNAKMVSSPNKTIKYLRAAYEDGYSWIDLDTFMVYEGTEQIDFIPRKEQKFIFPLGNEKLMLGDYLADDGIHHVREQDIFDGSDDEAWAIARATLEKTIQFRLSGSIYNTNVNDVSFLCNSFIHKKWIESYYPQKDEEYLSQITSTDIVISINRSRLLSEDVAGFKNWLSSNPVIIEHIREEEQIVPYTSAQHKVYNQIKNAYSYDEMTIITGSSDGNKPLFIVQAYKDINKELNNKVDKEEGKGLSTNDFTNTYKDNVDSNTNARHTHSNKSVLDNISSNDVSNWNGKYDKPSGGIPKTDLDSDVQTSLGKADTSIQSHQDISGKEDKENKVTSIDNTSTDTQYPSARCLYDSQSTQDDEIEALQTENERLRNTLPTTTGTGQDITLNKTAELEFVKPPLPMGNSEQESTTGKNLLATNDYGNYTINNDGTYTNAQNRLSSTYIPLDTTKTDLVFSCNHVAFFFGIAFYDENKNYLSRVYTNNLKYISGNIPSSTKYARTFFAVADGSIVLDGSSFSEYELQLEYGTTPTSFEPYTGGTSSPNPDYPQEITNVTGDVEVVVGNKNWFETNKLEQGNLSTSDGSEFWQSNYARTKFIKVESSTQYCITLFDTVNFRTSVLHFYDKEKQWINKTFTFSGFTTPANCEYIRFTIAIKDGSSYTQFDDSVLEKASNIIQLEYGTTPTTYVAHKEQTFTFPLGNEKLMLGDYLADDGIHHVRGQVVFDGSNDENWIFESENTNRTVLKILVNSIEEYTSSSAIPNLLSSHFITVSQAATWKPGNISRAKQSTTINKYIYVMVGPGITVNNFKTWLSTHNITVEYELEQEVIVPYTTAQQTVYNAIKQALSYEGQTNISSNQNAIFNVEAYQSTKLVLKEMATAIVALGGV